MISSPIHRYQALIVCVCILPSAQWYTLYEWHCKNKSFLSWGVTDCLNPEKLSSSDKLLDLDIVLPTTHFIAHTKYFQTIWIGGTTTNMARVKTAGLTHRTTVAFRGAPVKRYGHAQWRSLNNVKCGLNTIRLLWTVKWVRVSLKTGISFSPVFVKFYVSSKAFL